MKPRTQPIASLYFRWGRDIGLEAAEVAEALSSAGIIELISPDKFRELLTDEKVSLPEYEALIHRALTDYKNHPDRPNLVEVCAQCSSPEAHEVQAGDEGLTYCPDCQSVEGGYLTIKEEDL